MKSKIKLLLFLLFILASLTIPIIVRAVPTQISTCQELQDMNLNTSADYELSTDIDCTYDTQNPLGALYNSGSGFLPIDFYSGTFNGNNHTITGLFINRSGTNMVGLFGQSMVGVVSNVQLISANVTGGNAVGALIGWLASTASVTNSSSTGTVSGTFNVGGLVGFSDASTVSGSHSSATVTASDNNVGGLVGYSNSSVTNSYADGVVNLTGGSAYNAGGLVGGSEGSITNSHATGTVDGYTAIGGLVGWQSATSSITDSYASGTVSSVGGSSGGLVGSSEGGSVSTSYATGNVSVDPGAFGAGGLVGYAGGPISNSYARGSVTADAFVGGLTGAGANTITNSYATGLVTAASDKGGLVGFDLGVTVTDSYWDKETTGMTTSVGSASSYGKLTTEMKTQSTFVGWDFITIWGIDLGAVINNGYPYILWQAATPTPTPTSTPTPTPTASPTSTGTPTPTPVPTPSPTPYPYTLTPIWAVTATTASDNVSFSNHVTDLSGNSYVIGSIKGTGTYNFGNGVTATGNNSGINAVLLKYNSSGVAQWAVTAVSPPGQTQFVNIALSPAGDIYIVGFNYGTQTYDYGNGVTVSGVITPNANPFLIKYNSSGVAQWAKGNSAGAGPAEFHGVAVDSSDNTYVVGSIYGNGSYNFLDGVTVSGASATNGNWLLIKYNSSGVAQWAKSTVTAPNSSWLFYVRLDSTGNVYAAGGMTGTGSYDFGNSVTAAGGGASANFLLAKFNSSGAAQWVKTNSGATGYNAWNDLAVAGDGTTYTVGYASGTVTADLGNGVTVAGAGSSYNAFIAKYDSSGVAQWAKSTVVGPDLSSFGNIILDTSGNSYIAGYIYTTGTFNFGDGVTISGPGPYNPLIVKYDTDGVVKLAKTVVSSNSLPSFNGISLDSLNNVYISGYFTDAVNFDLGDGVSVNGAGTGLNPILAKYGESLISSSTSTPTPTPTPPGPPTCGEISPLTAPVLFQALRTGTTVKLWFTPVNANSTGYAIIYGYFPGDERFGVIFDQGYSSGALTYEIGQLNPSQAYTFKIQAKNGCASGPWSNYITAAASGSGGTPIPTPSVTPVGTVVPTTTPAGTVRPTSTSSSTPLATFSASPTSTVSAEVGSSPSPTDGSGTSGVTGTGEPPTGSETPSVVETLVGLSPQITDSALPVAAGAVTVAIAGEIVGLLLLITKPLYIIYTATPRHFYMFPIDYIGSVSQGVWQLILGFFGPLFGLIRKKSGQGRVFDGANGKPLSGAYVLFFSASGNLASDFTDKLGQYELKPKPDNYELRVDKNLYDFPSKLVTVRETLTYNHIYLPGEKFEIKDNGQRFNKLAVPLDPMRLKSSILGIFAKALHSSSSVLNILIPVIEIWGLIISGLAVYANPDIRYKLIFIVVSAFVIFDIVGRIIVSKEISNTDS